MLIFNILDLFHNFVLTKLLKKLNNVTLHYEKRKDLFHRNFIFVSPN